MSTESLMSSEVPATHPAWALTLPIHPDLPLRRGAAVCRMTTRLGSNKPMMVRGGIVVEVEVGPLEVDGDAVAVWVMWPEDESPTEERSDLLTVDMADPDGFALVLRHLADEFRGCSFEGEDGFADVDHFCAGLIHILFAWHGCNDSDRLALAEVLKGVVSR